MMKNNAIVYLDNFQFVLPVKDNKSLQGQIEVKISKKISNRGIFHMVKGVDKVSDNEFIKPVKNKTNIFFLNLLLLVANYKNIEIPENEYSNDVIVSWLEEVTNLDLKGNKLELIENKIYSFMIKNEDEQVRTTENQAEKLESNFFSLEWVKNKDKEI